MRLIPRFTVAYAEKCAWRAIYVYVYRNVSGLPPYEPKPPYVGRDAKVLHLGIDPTATYPAVFGSIGRWSWRVKLPAMAWRMGDGWIRKTWRGWIHSLDGRFDAETKRAIRRQASSRGQL